MAIAIATLLIAAASAPTPTVAVCFAVPGGYSGRCVSNYTGACKDYVSRSGYPGVFVFDGKTINDNEAEMNKIIADPRKLGDLVTPTCSNTLDQLVCALGVLPCYNITNSTGGVEAVPVLPCKSFCNTLWTQRCPLEMSLYYSTYVNVPGGSVNISLVPFCGPVGGSFTQDPQPADVFGVTRVMPSYQFYPSGYDKQPVFSDGTGLYRLLNGTQIQTSCFDPGAVLGSSIQFTDPLGNASGSVSAGLQCNPPTILAADKSGCVVPCPFPIWTAGELQGIQLTYAIPALAGVALCLLVLLDSLFVVLESTGWDSGKFAKLYLGMKTHTSSAVQNTGGNSSAKEDEIKSSHVPGTAMGTNNPTSAGGGAAGARSGKSGGARRQRLRASTLYALVGAILCIVYFIIGPLGVLVRQDQMSCATSGTRNSVKYQDILSGTADLSGTYCAAQRASPFVLQWIFNLILYATVEMLLASSMSSRQSRTVRNRVLQVALVVYCVFVPAICLGVALGLDKMSKELIQGNVHMMRSAAICTVRLDPSAEIVLVFLPFIITGFLVGSISMYVFFVLRKAQAKAMSNKAKSSSTDVALYHLTIRLAMLGVFTLALFVVQMVSTGVVQEQTKAFSQIFIDWWKCMNLATQCGNCNKEEKAYAAGRVTPTALAVQAASQSAIILLFGGFFVLQSYARLRREYADGVLGEKVRRVFLCGRGGAGASATVEDRGSSAHAGGPGGGGGGSHAVMSHLGEINDTQVMTSPQYNETKGW